MEQSTVSPPARRILLNVDLRPDGKGPWRLDGVLPQRIYGPVRYYLLSLPHRVVFALERDLRSETALYPPTLHRHRILTLSLEHDRGSRHIVPEPMWGRRYLKLTVSAVHDLDSLTEPFDNDLKRILQGAPHTGRRGRPAGSGGTVIKATVPTSIAEFVRRYGGGSVARGIRRLAKEGMNAE